MRQLVIVGAGGFGREVLDVVDAINEVAATFDFLGFLDDSPGSNVVAVQDLGRQVLGPVDLLTTIEADYLIGIGSPTVRHRIDELATIAGRSPAIAVHPQATRGAKVQMGPGTIVCAGARLTTNIRLGRHAQVHVNATIGHDCVLGDYATISPGACVSGSVTLHDSVTIGTGAVVRQGLTLGEGATIGAGAALVSNAPAGSVLVGVPAKPRGGRV